MADASRDEDLSTEADDGDFEVIGVVDTGDAATTIAEGMSVVDEREFNDDDQRSVVTNAHETPVIGLNPTPSIVEDNEHFVDAPHFNGEERVQSSFQSSASVASASIIDPHADFAKLSMSTFTPMQEEQLREMKIMEAIEVRRGAIEGTSNGPHINELNELRTKVESMEVSLAAMHSMEEDAERAIEEAKYYRRTLDETTARLMHAEDTIAELRNIQNGGFTSVTADAHYPDVLEGRYREEIDALKLENQQLKVQVKDTLDKVDYLQKEVVNLNGVLSIANEEHTNGDSYIRELRNIYESRLAILIADIQQLKGESTSAANVRQDCPKCGIRIVDPRLFQSHIGVCPTTTFNDFGHA